MRLLALAGALLLLGVTGASAQTLSADQLNQLNQSGQAGLAGQAGAASPQTSGVNTSAMSAAAGAGGASGASGLSGAAGQAGMAGAANPLAGPMGALSASVKPSQGMTPTQNPNTGGYIVTSDGQVASVFGTDLFTGNFAGTRPSDRPDYIIQVGDQIAINLYGAVNTGSVDTVDASGNVFITGVGPVHVLGVRAGELQSAVEQRVRSVFTGAVGVYAQVGSSGAIGVFVSGDVRRPGRYLGAAADTVMFYLSQAGGVDPTRGSFRDVVVRRGGQVIATYDLYDFLLKGQVQPMRFQEGDVIFVAPRGAMVAASGPVRNEFAFEAPHGRPFTGEDLITLARPEPMVNGAAVNGFRNGSHRSAYFPMDDLARVVLGDGDHVIFRSDTYRDQVVVTISGQIKGQTIFVMPRGATLSQLLAKVPLEGTEADPSSVHILRPSVAIEQKAALDRALYNLQNQVLTAAPITSEAAALATAQANLVNQFVAKASTLQPDGNIAVYSHGVFHDIQLENDDVIVLPNKTDTVIVGGQVLNPGALAHADGLRAIDYISQAGGYAANANKKHFLIRHRDGSAEPADPHTRPKAGDELVIMPKLASPWFEMVRDVSQLLFSFGITTAAMANVL